MTMNTKLIKNLLKKTAEEIIHLKGIFREPHQPRLSWKHRHELAYAKQRATILCSIQAHRRGKIHLRHFGTLEEQAAFIGDQWKTYELEEAAA
jgi:hypothetical protein